MPLARCSIQPEVRAIYKEVEKLTLENDKEYGILICKKGNKVASGKICIGDECSLDFEKERDGCPRGWDIDHLVHTHPIGGDNFSTSDIVWTGYMGMNKTCVISSRLHSVTCLDNLQRVRDYENKTDVDYYDRLNSRHQNLQVETWEGLAKQKALLLVYRTPENVDLDNNLTKREKTVYKKQMQKAIDEATETYHKGIQRITSDRPVKVKVCREDL